MAEADLIRLIESHSTELAALRELVTDGLQTLNWKLDRLVEVVDTLRAKSRASTTGNLSATTD